MWAARRMPIPLTPFDTVDGDFPVGSTFRRAAERLHVWTRERLDPEVIAGLAALPAEYRVPTPAGDLLVVHSSPRGTRDRRGGPHNTAEEATAAYSHVRRGLHWRQATREQSPRDQALRGRRVPNRVRQRKDNRRQHGREQAPG
jgi:hypothetical protein